MRFLPSSSSWLHLRFLFSLFLLPVFVFAVSQVPYADTEKAWLAFISWHFFIYPASNGYNSYFDKDEGSIALLKSPPKVDKSLYYLSLFFDLLGILTALAVSLNFAFAVIAYGILSKLYSHPAVRLKKYAIVSFLVVFIFQGGFVYWTSYAALSGDIYPVWDIDFILAGLACSCLIGASYPLTQIYQHDEDRHRGDVTLSMKLGIKGTFAFSAMLFGAGTLILYCYWKNLAQLNNFWLFLLMSIPGISFFVYWVAVTMQNRENANHHNMTRMTLLSGLMMLGYFVVVWIVHG